MFELLAVLALLIGAAGYRKIGRVQADLGAELTALKAQLEALKAAPAVGSAALVTPAVEALAIAAPVAVDAPPATPVPEAAPSAADAQKRLGDAIFGGAPPATAAEQADQDAVERASRGEPVAAREPRPTVTDSVAIRPKESLESRLGARWAVWVGGLALALGGIFMVKVSIDAGLLGPATRLTLATLFGLVLVLAGEIVRRRAVPMISDRFQNALIPGILTAAGAVTLFGVAYATYGIYGYVGAGAGFALLALVAFATIGLSLLHGQALAGLGLVASLATPLLVATESPDARVLFGYLAITWLATAAAARLRRWTIVPSIANIGLGLWMLFYIAGSVPFNPLPVTGAGLVMILGLALLWPGRFSDVPAPSKAEAEEKPEAAVDQLTRAFTPPFVAVIVIGAASVMLPALSMISTAFTADGGQPILPFAILIGALALYGAMRSGAAFAALLSAITALAGLWSLMPMATPLTLGDPLATGVLLPLDPVTIIRTGFGLSALFIALAVLALHRHIKAAPGFAMLWAALASAVPLIILSQSLLILGNLVFDLQHGLFALAFALSLLVLAGWLSQGREGRVVTVVQSLLVFGSAALLGLALLALTEGLVTTLLIALAGFAYVAATRVTRWPVLPWVMVAAALAVLVRIALDPTTVGPENLSTTPIFNALLAGYGIPTVLLVGACFLLRGWPDLRVMSALQGLASLFALQTIAILVRHGMNGGVLNDAVPTLGEQSIYTLIAIGGSGVLMTLDGRMPSPVFRYGSMGLGVVSMLSVLLAHLFALNPYFSGELLGQWPVIDLLLIGYLLPGIAYAGLALYARNRRPKPYVMALSITAAILAFSWATLSVRRFWQGQNIADWKGFLQSETYTYSVVWLLLGVLLLVLGSRFRAISIRLASAGLVFIAVLKVFLFDMSNLEGFLRALSFIGLGGVLIGIGLFYQKILSSTAAGPQAPADEKAAANG